MAGPADCQAAALAERVAAHIKDTEFEAVLTRHMEMLLAEGKSDACLLSAMFEFFEEHIPGDLKRGIYKDIEDGLQQ